MANSKSSSPNYDSAIEMTPTPTPSPPVLSPPIFASPPPAFPSSRRNVWSPHKVPDVCEQAPVVYLCSAHVSYLHYNPILEDPPPCDLRRSDPIILNGYEHMLFHRYQSQTDLPNQRSLERKNKSFLLTNAQTQTERFFSTETSPRPESPPGLPTSQTTDGHSVYNYSDKSKSFINSEEDYKLSKLDASKTHLDILSDPTASKVIFARLEDYNKSFQGGSQTLPKSILPNYNSDRDDSKEICSVSSQTPFSVRSSAAPDASPSGSVNKINDHIRSCSVPSMDGLNGATSLKPNVLLDNNFKKRVISSLTRKAKEKKYVKKNVDSHFNHDFQTMPQIEKVKLISSHCSPFINESVTHITPDVALHLSEEEGAIQSSPAVRKHEYSLTRSHKSKICFRASEVEESKMTLSSLEHKKTGNLNLPSKQSSVTPTPSLQEMNHIPPDMFDTMAQYEHMKSSDHNKTLCTRNSFPKYVPELHSYFPKVSSNNSIKVQLESNFEAKQLCGSSTYNYLSRSPSTSPEPGSKPIPTGASIECSQSSSCWNSSESFLSIDIFEGKLPRPTPHSSSPSFPPSIAKRPCASNQELQKRKKKHSPLCLNRFPPTTSPNPKTCSGHEGFDDSMRTTNGDSDNQENKLIGSLPKKEDLSHPFRIPSPITSSFNYFLAPSHTNTTSSNPLMSRNTSEKHFASQLATASTITSSLTPVQSIGDYTPQPVEDAVCHHVSKYPSFGRKLPHSSNIVGSASHHGIGLKHAPVPVRVYRSLTVPAQTYSNQTYNNYSKLPTGTSKNSDIFSALDTQPHLPAYLPSPSPSCSLPPSLQGSSQDGSTSPSLESIPHPFPVTKQPHHPNPRSPSPVPFTPYPCPSEDPRSGAVGHLMQHLFRNMLLLWCRQNQAVRSLGQQDTESDKTVLVSRASGEFGFRIHGSRPVVVSAIESDTPAETSGLEVGDIVLSINGVSVLEASHSEVVKLAHSGGCDTLRLEVARTCNLLAPLVTTDPTPVCAGYLYKLGAAHRAPGSSAITRRWHRRWFALTKDHCLYHYKSESDPHPLGAVVLRGHTVHAFSTASRPYAFTVCLAGEVGLQLAAHTAEARGRWGHVISQASEQAAQRDELLEASSRRVQQAPGAIAAPDCFGFLHRLGARWHQWKKRYCVLKDACLFLYHDTDATQAIGVVHLHGYRVQSTSIGGKKNAFELLPPEPKFRHFYFHTDSENDKKRWLAALEYSIDRWIKVG